MIVFPAPHSLTYLLGGSKAKQSKAPALLMVHPPPPPSIRRRKNDSFHLDKLPRPKKVVSNDSTKKWMDGKPNFCISLLSFFLAALPPFSLEQREGKKQYPPDWPTWLWLFSAVKDNEVHFFPSAKKSFFSKAAFICFFPSFFSGKRRSVGWLLATLLLKSFFFPPQRELFFFARSSLTHSLKTISCQPPPPVFNRGRGMKSGQTLVTRLAKIFSSDLSLLLEFKAKEVYLLTHAFTFSRSMYTERSSLGWGLLSFCLPTAVIIIIRLTTLIDIHVVH